MHVPEVPTLRTRSPLRVYSRTPALWCLVVPPPPVAFPDWLALLQSDSGHSAAIQNYATTPMAVIDPALLPPSNVAMKFGTAL